MEHQKINDLCEKLEENGEKLDSSQVRALTCPKCKSTKLKIMIWKPFVESIGEATTYLHTCNNCYNSFII